MFYCGVVLKVVSRKNLLITGVSGLLGGNLARYFSKNYKVFGIYHSNRPVMCDVTLMRKDLADRGDEGLKELERFPPAVIIHCAGEADVDKCETVANHAERNVFEVARSASEIANRYGAHLVSISTDAVSDGLSEYFGEDDSVSPINIYGKTKVRVENYLLSENRSAMIIRTRFYGVSNNRKKSFTERILGELAKGNEVPCFVDSYCTQIYAMNLASVLEESIEKRLCGVFNIVESQKHSRYEYAQIVARIFGLDERLIVPVLMASMSFNALRPTDTSLSNIKIKKKICSEIFSTEKGLQMMKEDMEKWG